MKKKSIIYIILIMIIIVVFLIMFSKDTSEESIKKGIFNVPEPQSEEPYLEITTEEIEENQDEIMSNVPNLDEEMSKIAAEYASIAEDLKSNESINEDGQTVYYEDYIKNDFPNININEVREIADMHADNVQSDLAGTDLYCLIVYLVTQKYPSSTNFICNSSDVEAIKKPFIYKCKIYNDEYTISAYIDVGNCKIEIID